MTYPPNSELVAVAWIGTVGDMPAGAVSLQLPKDPAVWEANGFVTVGGPGAGPGVGSGGVIGGAPDWYVQTRHPVLSVHTWANASGSARPPWGKAATLAEYIVAGCNDEDTIRRTLSLPTGYGSARVNEAYPLTEPRRVPGDMSGYAHFQMDLQLHWVALA